MDPFGADPRRVTTFLPKTDTVARAASILTYVLGEQPSHSPVDCRANAAHA